MHKDPWITVLLICSSKERQVMENIGRYSRLAPLNLLASCSPSDFDRDWGLEGNGRGGKGASAVSGQGRLRGRSPLS